MEKAPIRLPNGDLGCPYCKTQLVSGKSPYHFEGIRVGAFDSMRCQFCGFYVLSEEGRTDSVNALIELGLISGEEDTAEITVPVFDLIHPVGAQSSRVLPAEETKEASVDDTLVPLMTTHNASTGTSRYRM